MGTHPIFESDFDCLTEIKMPRRRHSSSSDSGSDSSDSIDNKRQRKSESHVEIEQRLESLICRIGEKSTSSLESNLEGLGKVLKSDLAQFKAYIIETLTLAAFQMPEKMTIYSTLVGWLNSQDDKFGEDFLQHVLTELGSMLKTERWEAARYTIRFISDLSNCGVLTPTSIVTFLDGILGVLSEEATPQLRKDTYLYLVLGALPWCGKTIQKNNSGQITRLLETIEAYVTARDKSHNDILRVWRSAEPLPQYDMIDALWRQIKNMAEEGWDDQGYIPRPYVAFEGLLEEAQRQTLPQFVVPPHTEDVNYPRPHVIFRLFTVDDCTTEQGVLPKSDSIVRFIVEENLFQIFLTYYKERKECAKKLLSYYNREKVPICHQVVEIMFASMFRLPDAPMIDIAYATIFIELCKLQPQNMPQALALATELLFERMDTMGKTATDRCINWFGHHLSNFQFRWQWDEWADCITQDENAPKPSFIREVLEKCRRFCYHQRIVETVPQDFEHLLPNEPSIRFKYRQDDDEDEQDDINPAVSCSRKLERAIRSRASQDEIFEILSEVPKPSSAFEDNDDDSADYNPNALDVFVQTLMFIASKTFSHSFSALHKYHMMLKRLARNEGAKVQLLQILFDMWRDHPQMLVVLVDKCIRAQIVDPGSVARWVFSPDMGKYFNRYYIWEILHGTITKMNHHVNRVQDEYDSILSRVHNASVKMEEDTEQEMMDTYGAFAPSESEVASYKEKLDNSKAEQKNLFLIIFQRFIAIITEHIDKHGPVPAEALLAKREPTKNETWLINALERLKEVFLKHEKVTVSYQQTLGELLFTDNVEDSILSVFSSFRALRS